MVRAPPHKSALRVNVIDVWASGMHARAVVIVCVWRQQEKKGERRQGKKDGADKAAFAPSARCGS